MSQEADSFTVGTCIPSTREMPGCCMVTPYQMEAASIVAGLWVMTAPIDSSQAESVYSWWEVPDELPDDFPNAFSVGKGEQMPAIAVPETNHLGRDASTEGPNTEGPNIFLDPSALTLLPKDVTVLARFVQFVSRDVLQEHIPADRIEIRGSVDPEDDTSQIVVRVWIGDLSDSEIRRYHHDLGGRVDSWAACLPEAQRLHFFSRISFQTRREADA
jgi:hypothetical protein